MHGGNCRHVPAANVLVEQIRRKEHCAGPTRATRQHKTHHTNKKNEARSEFKKVFERIRKGKVSKASEDRSHAARERTRAVGRRRGTRPLHTQIPPGIDARGKRTCERREALTSIHGGHCRHVPAANVLVERSRIIEHCRNVPHAPQATQKHITPTRRTRPGQSS